MKITLVTVGHPRKYAYRVDGTNPDLLWAREHDREEQPYDFSPLLEGDVIHAPDVWDDRINAPVRWLTGPVTRTNGEIVLNLIRSDVDDMEDVTLTVASGEVPIPPYVETGGTDPAVHRGPYGGLR